MFKRSKVFRGVERPGWFVYGSLLAILAASLFPFYYTLLIASGDSSTISDPNMSWWPGENLWSNMSEVFNSSSVDFWRAIGNSIVVATTVGVSTVLLSTLAGFAFSRLRFKGNKILYVAVIATMAVPVQLGVVPLYILMNEFGWAGSDSGWLGSMGAVIVPTLVTAFGVFWMTQYLQQALPGELIEAARVDGANMIRTFWHVAVPAARPAAAMLFLFTFVQSWNNFLWPFIVLDQSNPTLPVALSMLQSARFVDQSLVLAGVLIATLPLMLLFVFVGRQLVSGIMQGAVKG